MKHFVKFMALAAICSLFTFGASAQTERTQARARKADANLTEVTFNTDIHCQNCVKKIESKLPYVKGVKDLKCNVDDKTVWIQYDKRKTSPEKLADAIKKCGYTATVSTGKPAGKECSGECKNAEGKDKKECTGECKNAEGKDKKGCTGECKKNESEKKNK